MALTDAGGIAGVPESMTKPSRGWLKQTREDWGIIWEVRESQMLRPHHVAALRRLYDMYDECERMKRACRKKRKVVLPTDAIDGDAIHTVVEIPGYKDIGSQGQLVESVESKKLDRLRREIRQMEDRFAGTPMAQFRLGWQQAAMLNEQARASEASAIATAAREIQQAHEAREEEVIQGEIVE